MVRIHIPSVSVFCTLLHFVWAFPSDLKRRQSDDSSKAATLPKISQFVAFGDSYAAGIGAGSTSWNGCRVGANNYPQLLFNSMTDGTAVFEPLMCSGDTTKGANRQIQEWKNWKTADLATISIGGNDLGFGKLVRACILNFEAVKTWYEDCSALQTTAMAALTVNGEFYEKLQGVYNDITKKAENPKFVLYVTGYPTFFNPVVKECQDSTFYWWNPHHVKPSDKHGSVTPWLTTELRTEMNTLVTELNDFIKLVIASINTPGGRPKIVFVDPNPSFSGTGNGHRWCEGPNVFEPNPDRPQTYLFLGGWKDLDVGTSGSLGTAEADEEADAAGYINSVLKPHGKIELPNSLTCEDDLGTDPDPWAEWSCATAQAVASSSDAQAMLTAANADIAAGDFTSQHVPFFMPTNQIKTFHPRTPGNILYRDALISAIKSTYT